MASANTTSSIERNSWLVPFLDVLLIIVLILLPLVNPPKSSDNTKPPGELSAEIRWPDNCHADVDLWVQAPNDRPVGYANVRGDVMSLLRDDLGSAAFDLSGLNFEIAFSRGLPNGSYIANIHLYRLSDCPLPIKVDFSVTLHRDRRPYIIKRGTKTLRHRGEEVTLVRFDIQDENVVYESVNDLPLKLRTQ